MFTNRGTDAQFYNNDIFNFGNNFDFKPSKEMKANIEFYSKLLGSGELAKSMGLVEHNLKRAAEISDK